MDAERYRILKHELRTPLNHMTGYSGLLLEAAEDNDDDEMMCHIREVQAAARQIGAIFERVLRCEPKDGVPPGLESLGENVQSFLNIFRERIAAMSAVSYERDYGEDLSRILMAITRLESLLETLREEFCSLRTGPR